jgi:hypothetical protein
MNQPFAEGFAMKILIAPLVIAALALASTLPAAAQSKPDNGTSVGMATTHDPAADRNSYTQKAQGEMHMWEQKLQDFNAKAETKATAAETSASKDLDSAWAETRTASSQLETVSEKDWDSAKASFQTASHKLAVAWQKVNPKDK